MCGHEWSEGFYCVFMFNSYLPQNSKDAVFEGFSRSDRGGVKLGRAQIVPYLSVILRCLKWRNCAKF